MCDPVSFGISMALMQGASTYQQNKQASAQAEAQQKALTRASNAEVATINQQRSQVEEQASERATETSLNTARLASAARVSAAEGGIAGVGVNRLVTGIGIDEDRALGRIESNLEGNMQNLATQFETQKLNRETSTRSIEAQRRASTAGPLETVMRMGSAYFSGATTAASMAGPEGGSILDNMKTLVTDPGSFMTGQDTFRLGQAQRTGFKNPSNRFLDPLREFGAI